VYNLLGYQQCHGDEQVWHELAQEWHMVVMTEQPRDLWQDLTSFSCIDKSIIP
jgi:hypothetical protein